MRIVVAGTGPLNYLLIIGEITLLPKLFGTVHVPDAVRTELLAAGAPALVRAWATRPPPWLSIEPTPASKTQLPKLDAGEEAAITLAHQLKAELLLMDDRAGVKVALEHGFEVIGTLGVLDQAGAIGLIDLPAVFARLTATNYRVRPELIDAILAKHRTPR